MDECTRTAEVALLAPFSRSCSRRFRPLDTSDFRLGPLKYSSVKIYSLPSLCLQILLPGELLQHHHLPLRTLRSMVRRLALRLVPDDLSPLPPRELARQGRRERVEVAREDEAADRREELDGRGSRRISREIDLTRNVEVRADFEGVTGAASSEEKIVDPRVVVDEPLAVRRVGVVAVASAEVGA